MKKYLYKPYNPIFHELYKKEAKRLAEFINNKYIIEHIGSTAIPNVDGKGIIDIMIAVDSKFLTDVKERIQSAGYEFREIASTPTRLFFRNDLKDNVDGTRRYHIHLTQIDSKDWREAIIFRNHLINHPKRAEEYNLLKKEAVKQANQDGEVYRKLKEPFIKGIIERG